jgi:hypothetical protein
LNPAVGTALHWLLTSTTHWWRLTHALIPDTDWHRLTRALSPTYYWFLCHQQWPSYCWLLCVGSYKSHTA